MKMGMDKIIFILIIITAIKLISNNNFLES